jgi:conjugative transfer signal peptidase TraF
VPLAVVTRALRRPLVPALVVAALMLVVARAVAPCFTWNLSPSLPRGLYRLERAASPVRGVLVSFVPPPLAAELIAARGYLPASASLLKVIVALRGDRVCIDGSSFVVNGTRIGFVAQADSAGRALAPFLFCGAVPPGNAFVATTAPLSFDSRYFGPVPLDSLTVAVPVWTY